MTWTTRVIAIVALAFLMTYQAFGQQRSTAAATKTTTATTTATTATTTASEGSGEANPRTSYEVRTDLRNLLSHYPPEVSTILSLDPTLLSNDAFLAAGYPQLAEFVKANPEVQRNPRFFLREIDPPRRSSALSEAIEGLSIMGAFALVAFALAWLIRTIIEQRRWNRLSQTQSAVHNKILDRFATNEELLAYIKTPAGTKFLESAPIPLHSEPIQNAPMSRIMWSIQLGVVVVAGSLGLLLVSSRFDAETAKDVFALGVIAFSVGAGFIASAFVSLMMSKRLGIMQPGEEPGVR